MEPRVRLIDGPKYPVETIYCIWQASRHNNEIDAPDLIHIRCATDPELRKEVCEIFNKVVSSKLPIAQNLNFTFLLEGVAISFREQMVRHRIGTKVGERIGMDIIPDLESSTFWAQSIRYLQPRKFATNGEYRHPKVLATRKMEEARGVYISAMYAIEEAYNKLLDLGCSQEDAREVLPVGMTHRITWTLNLSTIQHVIGKRSCWLAQTDLWAPIIEQMIEEMCAKVSPEFRNLASPPCIKGSSYGDCPFKIENEAREVGTDPLPPCPLYLGRKPTEHSLFAEYEEKYSKLWSKKDVSRWDL